MARPKDTRTTKWLIHRESWHETRKDASSEGKHSRLPYSIDNMEGAKTMFGNYRRNTWRCRTYSPKLYRGRKPTTGVLRTKADAQRISKKYHKNEILVQIRGGAFLFVEPEPSVKPKKRRKSKRKR